MDLVSEVPDLEIVGVASSEQQVVALVRSEQPDVLLFDAEMTSADPMSVVRNLNAEDHRIRLIALSNHDDDSAVRRTLAAGFHRHVSKVFGDADLLRILLEEHVKLA